MRRAVGGRECVRERGEEVQLLRDLGRSLSSAPPLPPFQSGGNGLEKKKQYPACGKCGNPHTKKDHVGVTTKLRNHSLNKELQD